MLQEYGQAGGVVADHRSDVGELRRTYQSSKHRSIQSWNPTSPRSSRRSRWRTRLSTSSPRRCPSGSRRRNQPRGNAINQILHCSFRVEESCSQSLNDFLTTKAHPHQVLDCLLVLLSHDQIGWAGGGGCCGCGRCGGGDGWDRGDGCGCGFGDFDGFGGLLRRFGFLP